MKTILPHESAIGHATGEAVYIDDILVNELLLVGKVVYSPLHMQKSNHLI